MTGEHIERVIERGVGTIMQYPKGHGRGQHTDEQRCHGRHKPGGRGDRHETDHGTGGGAHGRGSTALVQLKQ